MIDNELLADALDASGEGICVSDALHPEKPLVYVNSGFEEITGYSRSEMLGRNCRILQADDVVQPQLELLRAGMREYRSVTVQLRNYRKDGTMFWNRLSVSPVQNQDGVVTHFIGVITDITDRVVMQLSLRERERELALLNEKFRELVERDELTGLYSRRYLIEALEREWNNSRSDAAPIWLFFIDLDHFKLFNDTYGHCEGDQALVRASMCFRRVFSRGSDVVGRYGGEEFLALVRSNRIDGCVKLGGEICRQVEAMQIPHRNSRSSKVMTASVGAIMVDTRTCSIDEAVTRADAALYSAKQRGRNRCCVWSEDSDSQSTIAAPDRRAAASNQDWAT